MNNIPLFPPAERFGLSLIALIRAIAGQAGWVVPRWLVAKVEADIWGFVEALSLLVAVVKEANLAAAAEPALPVKAAEPAPARPRGTARGHRARATGMATNLPKAGRQEAAVPRLPRLSPPRPSRQKPPTPRPPNDRAASAQRPPPTPPKNEPIQRRKLARPYRYYIVT